MKLTVYLHFQGDCREALAFYGEVFKTSPGPIVTYGDAPASPENPLPAGYGEKILHTTMEIGGVQIMFSDGFPGWEATKGNHMALTLNAQDAGEAKRIFDGLQAGGAVSMPLGPTFFSDAYGMLTDKFGVLWHVSVVRE